MVLLISMNKMLFQEGPGSAPKAMFGGLVVSLGALGASVQVHEGCLWAAWIDTSVPGLKT